WCGSIEISRPSSPRSWSAVRIARLDTPHAIPTSSTTRARARITTPYSASADSNEMLDSSEMDAPSDPAARRVASISRRTTFSITIDPQRSGPGVRSSEPAGAARARGLRGDAPHSRRACTEDRERAARPAPRLAARPPVPGEPLTQFPLRELPDARLRQRLEEDDVVRQPPLRHPRRQPGEHVLARQCLSRLRDDAGERPLLPALVRQADDGGL